MDPYGAIRERVAGLTLRELAESLPHLRENRDQYRALVGARQRRALDRRRRIDQLRRVPWRFASSGPGAEVRRMLHLLYAAELQHRQHAARLANVVRALDFEIALTLQRLWVREE